MVYLNKVWKRFVKCGEKSGQSDIKSVNALPHRTGIAGALADVLMTVRIKNGR